MDDRLCAWYESRCPKVRKGNRPLKMLRMLCVVGCSGSAPGGGGRPGVSGAVAAAVAAAVPPPAAYETNLFSRVCHKLFSAQGFFSGVDKTAMDDGVLVRRVAAVSAPRPALPQQGTLTLKLLWGRSAPKFFRTAELAAASTDRMVDNLRVMGCVERVRSSGSEMLTGVSVCLRRE